MNAERELYSFQERNQGELYLAGICRHPLLSLWGVCVYQCVGSEAEAAARAGALTC